MRIKEKKSVLLFLIASWTYALFSLPLSATIGMFAFAIALFVFKKGRINFRFYQFHLWVGLFLFFCLCTAFSAIDTTIALQECQGILNDWILIFMMSWYFQDNDNKSIMPMLKVILCGGAFVFVFTLRIYGFDGIIALLRSSTRIDSDTMNASTLGVILAYIVLVGFYYGYYYHWKLVHLLLIPVILIIVVSGSKKAILVDVAGILVLLVLANWKKGSATSIIKILFSISIAVVICYFVLKLPVFSNILTRITRAYTGIVRGYNIDKSTRERMAFIKLGFEIFKEHPLKGIGIDNAKIINAQINGRYAYLHNNYSELLADTGIIGSLLYYSLYFYIFINLFKMRNRRDKEYDMCLTFMIVLIVTQIGMVAYHDRCTYYYLLICFFKVKQMQNTRLEGQLDCVAL